MKGTGLLALLTFGVAGSGSPGPNNTLLLASGVRFGFRRSLRHVLGTAIGIGVLVVAVAAGLGVVLQAVPAAHLVLKIAGSAYLLYLAYRIAALPAGKELTMTDPLTLKQAVLFQFLNPKGWIFAIAVVAAFIPSGPSPLLAGLVVAAVLAIVVASTASIWALGGEVLSATLASDRSRRTATALMAILMVASVAFLWI